MKYNTPRKDDAVNQETAAPYLEKLPKDICEVKENADVVLVISHIGGQFNLEPGIFAEMVIQAAKEAGADAIIASYPHIVQKVEINDGVPCFYLMGNFGMSPNYVYWLHENSSNYGLVVHLYLKEKQIDRVTFSILKIVESRFQMLTFYPVDILYQQLGTDDKRKLRLDVQQIYGVIVRKGKEGRDV